jgi:hypothetical protein
VYQDVPTPPENMQQCIIDECAAMNLQVTTIKAVIHQMIVTLH